MYSATNLLVKAITYKKPIASKIAAGRFKRWYKQNKGKRRRMYCNDKREYYREEYLKSDHWKQLKRSKLKDKPYCEHCGFTRRLDVHHLDYKNLYDVLLTDLLTLCRRCHVKEHERLKCLESQSTHV